MSFILLGILNSQTEAAAAGAYDLLETTVLSSAASSVTFSSLNTYSDYKHLQLRLTSRGSDYGNILGRINGDTGNNYSTHFLTGDGSSVSSAWSTTVSYFSLASAAYTGVNSSIYGAAVIDILDFSNTSKNKTLRTLTGMELGSGYSRNIRLTSTVWLSTSAITSLTVLPGLGSETLIAGSRFSLYGIK